MFDLSNPKLQKLAEIEGYADPLNLLEDNAIDSVIPAICMNEDCDLTEGMEPDQDRGFCDNCGTQSMKSCLVLAGAI